MAAVAAAASSAPSNGLRAMTTFSMRSLRARRSSNAPRMSFSSVIRRVKRYAIDFSDIGLHIIRSPVANLA